MVESSSGMGEALTPTVISASNVGSLDGLALSEARAKTKAENIETLQRAVVGAQAKVVRQQEHLAGAYAALERIEAELAVAEGV